MINFDNPVFNAINKAVNMAYASVLWVLFSLPVVTIGASTTALYYTIHKVVKNDTGKLFGEFWSAFRQNFKQATIVFLIVVVILLIGAVDIFVLRMYLEHGMIFKVLMGITIILMALTVIAGCYIFPYIARFENTTKLILLNSVYFAVMNILKTMGLLIILAIAVLMVMLNPVFLAVSPGLYMFCADYLIEPIFKKYMTPEDLEEERKRNEICSDL